MSNERAVWHVRCEACEEGKMKCKRYGKELKPFGRSGYRADDGSPCLYNYNHEPATPPPAVDTERIRANLLDHMDTDTLRQLCSEVDRLRAEIQCQFDMMKKGGMENERLTAEVDALRNWRSAFDSSILAEKNREVNALKAEVASQREKLKAVKTCGNCGWHRIVELQDVCSATRFVNAVGFINTYRSDCPSWKEKP